MAVAAAVIAAGALIYFFLIAPDRAGDAAPDIQIAPAEPTESPAATPTAAPTASPTALSRSAYDAKLTLDTEAMILRGKLIIDYCCTSEAPVYAAVLNLYPNGVAPGCLTVNSVSVDGIAAYCELSENGQQLTVPLNSTLTAGNGARIYIDYTVAIPETGDRFGCGKSGIILGNALPTLALCENGVWRTDAYDDKGDTFVSEVSDYTVAITLPAEYTIACTGYESEQRTEADGSVTHYIQAPLARDFALAARRDAYISSAYTSAGVAVLAMARNQSEADYCAQTACEALEFFSSRIGAYPYTRFCVAQMDADGGMEYPGMILINYNACRDYARNAGDYILSHEVAHQWWYAVVGSDQVNHPWQDESLTEFMGLEFLRCCRDASMYDVMLESEFASLEQYVRMCALDTDVYSLGDYEYVTLIYNYGAKLFLELFNELGETTFYSGLQNYYNANMFKIATGEQLVEAFSMAAGQDMTDWFYERMREPTLEELYGTEFGIGGLPQG